MVRAEFKVIANKFYYNKSTCQLSVIVSAKAVKQAMNTDDRRAAHKLIEPLVAVVYFNRKKECLPTQISEEEEFEGEDESELRYEG